MMKIILTICLAVTAVLALQAETFTGNIVVTRNGQTNNAIATVTVTQQSDGLNTLVLQVPGFGTMTMNDVHSAYRKGVTVYSAERDVTTLFGDMRTIVFARTIDGMMAANVAIPAQNTTMWFNTVGDHFQMPNSDMEDWNSSYANEPSRWHGFKSASGALASFSPAVLEKSQSVHPTANGQYSAVVVAKSVFGVVANGTMTNGRLNAGSMSASDSTNNYAASVQTFGNDFYMPLTAKPDVFRVLLKYKPGVNNPDNSYRAKVSVKTFDGTYYQEPFPAGTSSYSNVSGSIVGGQIAPCEWTEFLFPFNYDNYAANGAETNAIFVTFSTNIKPGTGASNDSLYIDEIVLQYLGAMTDLRYQGTTINGWDPAVTTYSMQMAGEPNLDDFDATIEGVDALLLKSMEQNADGSYRIAISVVSADLQNAACYIINVTAPAGIKGDVDDNGLLNISDVTTLINYLLSNNADGINMDNADVDSDGHINISDVTTLINKLLSGN